MRVFPCEDSFLGTMILPGVIYFYKNYCTIPESCQISQIKTKLVLKLLGNQK